MALRTADKFRFDLVGQLEVELATARDDFEVAMTTVQRTAGVDPKVKDDEPFERGSAAWARLREHRARVLALEDAMEIAQKVRVSE